jgi:putative GTP pyrophosphokinase
MNNEIFNVNDYFKEDLINSFPSYELFIQYINEYIAMSQTFGSAIDELITKLNIIDKEFKLEYQRNPIYSIRGRIKSPQSIVDKLKRKNLPITIQSARSNLTDLAGVRVICHYIDDIYRIAELLTFHEDIHLIKKSDYIATPKPNGYRSLHIVINLPVYFSSGKEYVPLEVQIRTLAMDSWASLEHQMRYKGNQASKSQEYADKLRECAETIQQVNLTMQDLYFSLYDENRLGETSHRQ